MNNHADVLLVTVTKTESRAVLDVFQKKTGRAPNPVPIGDRLYHDLGIVNDVRVFMALSEMGSGGLGASLQAVEKGIDALSPAAVIMVGNAFGVNEQKQAIGDILVSQQLWLYDLQRVGVDKIIPRGDKPHASPWLFNCFQGADLYWDESKAKVRFGLILSGEKLVDNVDYRDQLRLFEPEVIGGDMEGAGLYVACQDRKADWILVKGICDWADGHKSQDKDQRQELAARNAASFVLFVLQLARFNLKGSSQVVLVPRDNLPTPREMNRGRLVSPFNPFTPLSGRIDDPAKVFDRDREISRVLGLLQAGSSVALIGPAGIGKSSLMTKLCALALQRLGMEWEVIYIDLQLIGDEGGFYKVLCQRLCIPTCNCYDLAQVLGGRRILLCLDEIEKMTWDGFTRGLRAELRGLADGRSMKLILAARTPLDRLFPDSEGMTSPLANLCAQIDVKPWDEETAHTFLVDRLAGSDIAFSSGIMAKLVNESRGHPARLMRAAYDLCVQLAGGIQ